MTQIVFVYGTRPEAIKIGPVSAALRRLKVEPVIIATGQHTDLLRGTPTESDLRGGKSLGLKSLDSVEGWLHHAAPILQKALPDESLVVVQGDTMSAYAGAVAASQRGLPIAHIEAGVRSFDLSDPWPEEDLRRRITRLADWHYAPTSTAWSNLAREGIPPNRIVTTGNPVVSALNRYTTVSPVAEPEPEILVTMHRREWRTKGGVVETVNAFAEAAREYWDWTIRWPVHPAIKRYFPKGAFPDNLILDAPLAYERFAPLLASCWGVITDSGGVQEEAATLGVPTAVLRHNTDRPEAVAQGIARLFDPDAVGVEQAFEWLRHPPERKPSQIYGTPEAAFLIAQHLANLARRG